MTMIVHLDDIKDYNDLTGPIPTEIGMLTKLTELDLGKWLHCLDFLVY